MVGADDVMMLSNALRKKMSCEYFAIKTKLFHESKALLCIEKNNVLNAIDLTRIKEYFLTTFQ